MLLPRILRRRLKSVFRGARADDELRRELVCHVDELTREYIESGMDPEQARLAARRAMGGLALIEEQCRDHRRIAWFAGTQRNLAYAWRMLCKTPGFSALAILTLALGVGAGIAVYTLAEALLLRSLPYPSPERLVTISSYHVRKGESGVGQEDFRDWQASNHVFERMAFTEFSQMTLTGWGDPERITGRSVSEGFFEMLGVQPAPGRWFTPEEQKPGKDRVVLLSHSFWMRKLEGRPDIIGDTITLDGRPCRITGIMPASFRFNEGVIADYWTPIGYRSRGRRQHQYGAYGRLKPGVSVEAAQADMSEIARRLESAYPETNKGWGVRVLSMRGALLDEFGPALLAFVTAALFLLLVACANVASLLLARGTGRSKEIAVRLALGAGRRRVIGLLLTESMLLSSLGAVLGLILASWLVHLAVVAAPAWLQLGDMVAVSPAVVVFSVALTLSTGLLTGLWPALRASHTDLQDALKESGASLTAGRRQRRSLNGLVVAEIALAVALLTLAGLLVKSLVNLIRTDPGYPTERLLTFRIGLPPSRYPDDPARFSFWDQLLPGLASLPGVTSVGAADGIPLGGTYSGLPVELEGRSASAEWADVMTRASSVTPDYFRAMGITLRAGRTFTSSDMETTEPVVIINETFRRKFMPDEDPMGRRIRLGGGEWLRIVGVIGDLRYQGPARPAGPEAYRPFRQDPWLQFVVLRTAVPESAVAGAVRGVVRDLDPGLAITQLRTMGEAMELQTALPRRLMSLMTSISVVTLGLAILGLSGVMAYTVAERKREIALRMALGARGGDIARAVFRSACRLVFAGCALGALAAFAAARLLESLLYGVRPHDPLVSIAAPLLPAVVALLASIAPARRAASTDPMTALRQE